MAHPRYHIVVKIPPHEFRVLGSLVLGFRSYSGHFYSHKLSRLISISTSIYINKLPYLLLLTFLVSLEQDFEIQSCFEYLIWSLVKGYWYGPVDASYNKQVFHCFILYPKHNDTSYMKLITG